VIWHQTKCQDAHRLFLKRVAHHPQEGEIVFDLLKHRITVMGPVQDMKDHATGRDTGSPWHDRRS